MKIHAYFLFVLTFISLMAMEEKKGMKRSAQAAEEEITLAEPEAVQEEAEPVQSQPKPAKIAKTQKATLERSPLEELPPEIKIIIIKALESVPGSTEEAQLFIAANNIRNLMMTNTVFQPFLEDSNFAEIIIKELAERYAGNDLVEAAVALATDAAGRWLSTQFENPLVKEDAALKLYLACRHGQSGIVKFLLKYIPSKYLSEMVNGDINGKGPLFAAVFSGNLQVIDQLLAIPGIDVNKATLAGNIPLIVAAGYGPTAIVERLLAAPGIDVNRANKNGDTALMLASVRYPAMVAQLLAAPGINLTLHNQGMRALQAAIWNDHPMIVKQLLEVPGIDINQKGSEGHTLLWYAQQSTKPNKDAIIKLLKDMGATE